MKCRVRTGGNRCKWVWMGVDGCISAWGACKTQKQGKRRAFSVSQARNWVVWPGKFPRTSCFGQFGKKWYGWVQMVVYRFRWVRMNAWARREAKTRQKEPQMGEQGMFYDVCTQCKKTGSGRRWPCWSEGIIWRN